MEKTTYNELGKPINIGINVDRVGLGAYTSNSNAMTAGYDWFRRIS